MSEYISREEMIEAVKKENDKTVTYHTLYARLLALSPADVRENIHGHWKRRTYIGNHETVTMFVCSECDKEFGWDIETGIAISDNNFCPNCGADMRGEAK